MLSRANRITRKSDFDRLSTDGQSLQGLLLAVRFGANGLPLSRFGFACGKRVGGAVIRNRVRRRLRHQARALLPLLASGWDILVIVRPKAAQATSSQLHEALSQLLDRRGLLARTEKR